MQVTEKFVKDLRFMYVVPILHPIQLKTWVSVTNTGVGNGRTMFAGLEDGFSKTCESGLFRF